VATKEGVVIYDAKSGAEVVNVQGAKGSGGVYSADGKWLATVSATSGGSREFSLWEADSGNNVRKWRLKAGVIAFAPDGRHLLVGNDDGTVYVLRLANLGPVDILTSPDWEWSEPENLGPNINSDQRDNFPTLSADGLILIFTSDRGSQGQPNKSRLYECRRDKATGSFGKPVEIKETSETRWNSSRPFLTGDGLTLFFTSNRPGGSGGIDIWTTRRVHRDTPWQQPVNLGGPVNTDSNEQDPGLSPDGLTLYFSSTRNIKAPAVHLWMSRRKTLDALFEEPIQLGRDINAVRMQGAPCPTADGRGFLFYRSGDTKSASRLYLAIRMPEDKWTVQPLGLPGEGDGKVRDTTPALSADGRALFFSSDRPGGQDESDLWMVRRVPREKAAER
jgi:Tol biopolymer transport system component